MSSSAEITGLAGRLGPLSGSNTSALPDFFHLECVTVWTILWKGIPVKNLEKWTPVMPQVLPGHLDGHLGFCSGINLDGVLPSGTIALISLPTHGWSIFPMLGQTPIQMPITGL